MHHPCEISSVVIHQRKGLHPGYLTIEEANHKVSWGGMSGGITYGMYKVDRKSVMDMGLKLFPISSQIS